MRHSHESFCSYCRIRRTERMRMFFNQHSGENIFALSDDNFAVCNFHRLRAPESCKTVFFSVN